MTSRRDPIDAVEDILRNLRLAREFVGDALTVDELEGDTKTLYSLVRALEVVGEATKRVGSRAELHGLPEELAASKKVAISGAHGVVIGEILMLFLGVRSR